MQINATQRAACARSLACYRSPGLSLCISVDPIVREPARVMSANEISAQRAPACLVAADEDELAFASSFPLSLARQLAKLREGKPEENVCESPWISGELELKFELEPVRMDFAGSNCLRPPIQPIWRRRKRPSERRAVRARIWRRPLSVRPDKRAWPALIGR